MIGSALIYAISGQLSAGKTTVARAVLDRSPFGFHIDVDGIREMVTSGLASPLDWTDETTRQFDLAIRAAAGLARIYVEAGFTVAIEGAIETEPLENALEEVGVLDRLIGVVLHPPVEVALQRNRERQTKSFDTSILDEAIREIDRDLAIERLGERWTRMDNSDESVDETVERVLAIRPVSG